MDYFAPIAFAAIVIAAVVGFFIWVERDGQAKCIERHGSSYEYRYQHYSADVCVNPGTGEMRYL